MHSYSFPHGPHLRDDDLFDAYVHRTSGADATVALPHLDECAECAQRFAELQSFLQGVRHDALAAADAAMTPELLSHQRAQILRRLDGGSRTARVLTFPAPAAPQHQARVGVRRWTAVAAAAGLIFGFAAGRIVDLYPLVGELTSKSASISVQPQPSAVVEPATPAPRTLSAGFLDEEAFLLEVDAALERPHVAELLPLDELTPRAVAVGLR